MNNNKNILSVVFFGTPEFARFCLQYLIERSFNVRGVVTAPDKKAGRGKKLKSSADKIFSEKEGLKIFQPLNLKNSIFINIKKHIA